MKHFFATVTLSLLALSASGQNFDNLPDPIEDVNKVVDNTPDSIAKALMSRPAPGSTRPRPSLALGEPHTTFHYFSLA